MSGIAGFCDFRDNLLGRIEQTREIAKRMGNSLNHRGPDAGGEYLSENIAFAHRRLIVIDPTGDIQPMVCTEGGNTYVMVYNGRLYNTPEVRTALQAKGHNFLTVSDTEVVLRAYIEYGKDFLTHLNGVFALAIWDDKQKSCFLARDRFGIKPLFYTIAEGTLVFGSEIKALFEYPGIKPIVDENGLCEIFGLGPARTPGCGVYRGIHELKPGHAAVFNHDGLKTYPYWQLTARPHTDSYEQTVDTVRELLFDSIRRQMASDVPLCSLLSGGLDSSIVSAVAARAFREKGETLETYSFEFADNSRYFKPSAFQPSEDGPFAALMAEYIGSRHRVLVCETSALITGLYGAVRAKDLPGMTDIDSSLLYFGEQIKPNHTVCLSGECADEIFGGYPWFRDPEAYETHAFPWSKKLDLRKEVLAAAVRNRLPLDEYVQDKYEKSLHETPRLDGEDALHARQREIAYLNITWFMATLLERKDRMTMASGLEARVPFADYRLVEYLYNVPWELKYHNERVKALLKDASLDILPPDIIGRKKSPYPKSYHPGYEKELIAELKLILSDRYAPLHELVDTKALYALMDSKSDLGRPWFGQLMALPQMYAYLIEVNYWLERYGVEIRL